MTSVYLGIMGLGVAIVAFLFLMEARKNKKNPMTASQGTASILERLGPDNQEYTISDLIAKQSAKPQPNESQVLLEENLAKTAQLEELQTKYEKLDKIFKEKNDEFEKVLKELENETKNRKEFNKVKDLLEKEIKDLRDKNHKLQLELSAANAEAENHKKKATQLDDKISARDKEIREKEKQIDELVKRMQTFAAPAAPELTPEQPSPSPVTSVESDVQQGPQSAKESIAETPVPADTPKPEVSDLKPDEPGDSSSTQKEPEARSDSPSESEAKEQATAEEDRPHLNPDLLKPPEETSTQTPAVEKPS